MEAAEPDSRGELDAGCRSLEAKGLRGHLKGLDPRILGRVHLEFEEASCESEAGGTLEVLEDSGREETQGKLTERGQVAPGQGKMDLAGEGTLRDSTRA